MAGDRPRRWLSPVGVLTVAALLPFFAAASVHEPAAAQDPAPTGAGPVFATSDQCIACHSNIEDDDGADISIGHAWRATMMANAARDPYWQASVRRESIDNPGLRPAIEDTCSTCHMPMARTAARADGRMGEVFAHTGRAADASVETAQAWDGVSCTVCHQIAADNFGEHESFDGGYVIATGAAPDADGPALSIRSMNALPPRNRCCDTPSRSSPSTDEIGAESTAGYRDELQVTAPAADLELAADLTDEHLRRETAEFGSLDVRFDGGAVVVDVDVHNLAGHKLPTAYPSRRAWIHLTARDQAGRTIFESGAPRSDGSIAGNANDHDAGAFEPHYTEITAADQVQIYEPIIGDSGGNVTTALLRGVRYLKDNRLLPEGFDKAAAASDVAVQGAADADTDFTGGGDRVRYRINAGDGVTSVSVTARLLFQTIGYRWARNLADYDAFETNRFVGYYEANADGSVMVLAESSAEGRR